MDVLAQFAFPWDKLIGPIVTVIGVFIAAQARRGAKALERMKDNIDEVPTLVAKVEELTTEVSAAHQEAKDVGDKFTAFAEESSADRKALHENLHEVRNGMQMTVAVAAAVGSIGDGLARIASHMELVMKAPVVPDGPPRREVDAADDDWRGQRRREPYRGPDPEPR